MQKGLKEDGSISHRQYDQLLQKLMELEWQGDIELYAGDCPLEDTGAVLGVEQHYTVCHYIQCRGCGADLEPTTYRKRRGGMTDVYQKILGQLHRGH